MQVAQRRRWDSKEDLALVGRYSSGMMVVGWWETKGSLPFPALKNSSNKEAGRNSTHLLVVGFVNCLGKGSLGPES